MESGRSIPLVCFHSPTDIEVTTEGIQFLQSLHEPLAVVCVVGPPAAGKSSFCRWLLGRPTNYAAELPGISVWSEPLTVMQKDEKGTEREVSLLVLDTESFMGKEYGV